MFLFRRPSQLRSPWKRIAPIAVSALIVFRRPERVLQILLVSLVLLPLFGCSKSKDDLIKELTALNFNLTLMILFVRPLKVIKRR